MGLFDENIIKAQVDKILKSDRKLGYNSELKYSKGKYSKRTHTFSPTSPASTSNTRYIGTAGEYAVMSELLYRGYNVNRMVIDDGLDIIASKADKYYYVQVKTTLVDPNKNLNWTISIDAFDAFRHNYEVRYVFVARYNSKKAIDKKGQDQNLYFVMSSKDIEKEIYAGHIKRSDTNISIKIKFSPKTGEPLLYDSKEDSALFYLNDFDLR